MNLKNSTDERIRWQNSLTNSSNIVSRLWTIENYKEMIEDLANFFYNIEPKVTELHKMIEQANTSEELDAMKDLIKHTDSITMFNLWNEKKIKIKW